MYLLLKLVFHRLGIQLYKYNFVIIPIPLRRLFPQKSSVHNYNTRNSNKLRSALARHTFRETDIRFISLHVWNFICDNVNVNVSFPSLVYVCALCNSVFYPMSLQIYRVGDTLKVHVMPCDIHLHACFSVLEVLSRCLCYVRICTQVIPFIVLAQIM